MKRIKNADSVDHTWVGQTITAGSYFTIDPSQEVAWASDLTLIAAIATHVAVVNDGTNDFTDANLGLNFLKDFPQATNADGVPIIETNLRKSHPGFVNFTIVSHDLSDRTTWYQRSLAVTNETLTDSGNGLMFTSANAHWINMKSKKLTVDYKKVLERDGSLSNASLRYAAVKVNGVTKTETTDYTVNYPTGQVTFVADQTGNTITASYYHNNNVAKCSEFLLTPPTNKQYRLEHVESQFSKNAVFNDAVMIEIWAGSVSVSGSNYSVNLAGYADFANFMFDAGYGQSRSAYRSMKDLINWCTNAYPTIPACGDIVNDILCFPFLYIVHPAFSAKQGTCVRIFTEHDQEVTAEICTVTFYMEKGPA